MSDSKDVGSSDSKNSEKDTSEKKPYVAANARAGGMLAPGAQGKTPKPVPSSGVAAKKEGDLPAAGIQRRGFLSWLGLGWIAFAAMNGAALTSLLRFLIPNVLFEPPSSFRAGRPEEFAPGVVDERFKDAFGVWVVRLGDSIFALSTVCTHLGCTPSWLATDEKFKCPCHGSGFYMDGLNFEGPAPRPLERYKIFLNADGFVVIDKSRKFLSEKDWTNPDALIQI